jgi:hypothetical protein
MAMWWLEFVRDEDEGERAMVIFVPFEGIPTIEYKGTDIIWRRLSWTRLREKEFARWAGLFDGDASPARKVS